MERVYFLEGREVKRFGFPGQEGGTVNPDEAIIIFVGGQMSEVPWIRYRIEDRWSFANCAALEWVQFDE